MVDLNRCPLGGPRCDPEICDCFIDSHPEFPLDLHPEVFRVVGVGCSLRERRAGMSEDEFWDDVAYNLFDTDYSPLEDYVGPDLDDPAVDAPCLVCGSIGACGYDSEGRPLIHTSDME